MLQSTSLRFRDRGVGFFLFREDDDGVGFSALSGLYESGRTPGLGYALLYGVLIGGRTRRLRLLSSSISANNVAVVKTHMALGFGVVAVHYVYVRHLEEATPDMETQEKYDAAFLESLGVDR